MKDKPTVDYREFIRRYQAEAAKKVKAKADSLSNVSVDQKTKQSVADIKTALIKWTIIILIAACVFYFVYPKYTFRLPTGGLYKANKTTGTVKRYNHERKQWREY